MLPLIRTFLKGDEAEMFKKSFKASFCSVLVIIMLISSVTLTYASTPRDINKSSGFAKDSISYLHSLGIVKGDSQGNFNPKASVTRGQAITMLVGALKLPTEEQNGTETFKDVPTSHWANKYVEAAYKAGIIKGNKNGIFGVNDICTREQLAAMFVRTLGLQDDDIAGAHNFGSFWSLSDNSSIAPWAKDYVSFVLMTELMKGTGENQFSPRSFATREQAAVLIDRLISNKGKFDEITDLYKAVSDMKITVGTYGASFSVNVPFKYVEANGVFDSKGKEISSGGQDIFYDGRFNQSIPNYKFSYSNMEIRVGERYEFNATIAFATKYGDYAMGLTRYITPSPNDSGIESVWSENGSTIVVDFAQLPIDDTANNVLNYKIYDSLGKQMEIDKVEYWNAITKIYLREAVQSKGKARLKITGLEYSDDNGARVAFPTFEDEIAIGRAAYNSPMPQPDIDKDMQQLAKLTGKNISIVYNGNKINLLSKPIIKSGELLVPTELIEKMGHEVYPLDSDKIMLGIHGGTKTKGEYNEILLKLNNTTAFLNVSHANKPFEHAEQYQNSAINLNAAPTKQNGVNMVPLSIIGKTSKAAIYIDPYNATINIRDRHYK